MQHLIAKVRFQIAVGCDTEELHKGGHPCLLQMTCNGSLRFRHAANTISNLVNHANETTTASGQAGNAISLHIRPWLPGRLA